MQDPPCDRIVELGAKRHDGADYVDCCYDSPPADTGGGGDQDPEEQMNTAEILCAGSAATCTKHCKEGNSYACIVLGGMYWDGDTQGVRRDRPRGAEYFRLACRQGNRIGCRIIEDFEGKASRCRLVEGCESPCAAGLWSACVKLADAYIHGKGVKKSPRKAVALLRRGCDAGDGASCNGLGYAYGSGIGVAKNMAAAVRALRKGCEAGHDMACRNLVGAECIVAAITPEQRRPKHDAKCAKAKSAPSSNVDASKRYLAYEHPNQNRLDLCFDAIRHEGCFQLNILAEDTSIYCCP